MLAAGAALGLVAAGLLAARPWLEQAIRVRIARVASRHGLVAAVREVELGLRPPLHLRELRVAKPGGWTAVVERLDVGLRPWGRGLVGRLDLDAGPATIDGPGGLRLRVEPTRWRLTGDPTGAVRAELQQADGRLEVTRSESAGGWRIEAIASDLPAGELVEVFRDGAPILDAGTVNGTVEAEKGLETIRFDTALAAAGLRALALSGEADSCPAPCFGPPADVALELQGTWRPAEGALHLPRWRVTMDGAAASGALALAGLPADPHVDLAFAAEQVDFARLFRTSGLALDGATAIPAAAQPGDAALGSASLAATFKGRLLEARGVAVSQRLEFSPPLRFPAGVERLRADFVHEVRLPSGTRRIDVSPTSPDFIALAEVPPLFLRALLISEDAGFYGHRGIDLSELPPALLANWTRGGAFRGASTITQQLAKNLFLSREKRLDRKLRELSLALLLEAALGKDRILELYVNVIEWGPDLYGLRPAARRYFGREPGELTPRQAAFLVALIPGPVKYQPSFSGGTPTRGFDRLVDEVLAKLRSVDALGEEEYRAALEEVLCVEPPSGDAAP